MIGSITKSQLEEIAQIKLPDLNTTKISSAIKIQKIYANTCNFCCKNSVALCNLFYLNYIYV